MIYPNAFEREIENTASMYARYQIAYWVNGYAGWIQWVLHPENAYDGDGKPYCADVQAAVAVCAAKTKAKWTRRDPDFDKLYVALERILIEWRFLGKGAVRDIALHCIDHYRASGLQVRQWAIPLSALEGRVHAEDDSVWDYLNANPHLITQLDLGIGYLQGSFWGDTFHLALKSDYDSGEPELWLYIHTSKPVEKALSALDGFDGWQMSYVPDCEYSVNLHFF